MSIDHGSLTRPRPAGCRGGTPANATCTAQRPAGGNGGEWRVGFAKLVIFAVAVEGRTAGGGAVAGSRYTTPNSVWFVYCYVTWSIRPCYDQHHETLIPRRVCGFGTNNHIHQERGEPVSVRSSAAGAAARPPLDRSESAQPPPLSLRLSPPLRAGADINKGVT